MTDLIKSSRPIIHTHHYLITAEKWQHYNCHIYASNYQQFTHHMSRIRNSKYSERARDDRFSKSSLPTPAVLLRRQCLFTTFLYFSFYFLNLARFLWTFYFQIFRPWASTAQWVKSYATKMFRFGSSCFYYYEGRYAFHLFLESDKIE